MKLAILGYGVEGQSVEKYFKSHPELNAEITIFDKFKKEDLDTFNLQDFDQVFRTPSVHPKDDWTSATKLFFEKCPATIIGVTGTKGKGTTCSILKSILETFGKKVWLVGNIGTPALDTLDSINPDDVVIYEMSSFQLWDLEKSPHISIVLRIEPDHLDIHDGFDDYVAAKTNIVKHQSSSDYCVYYSENTDSQKIAKQSKAKKLSYPFIIPEIEDKVKHILNSIPVPGNHNHENAEAAILAASAYFETDIAKFINENYETILRGVSNFKGLPHRIQFIREVNGVRYYDDNYSSAFPAMDVAIKAFPSNQVVLIAGGKDRGLDLTKQKRAIFDSKNIKKAILIGETKEQLASNEDEHKYILADTLEEAVKNAAKIAEPGDVIIMSPGAASFDMFKNFLDRGEQFQTLVKEL